MAVLVRANEFKSTTGIDWDRLLPGLVLGIEGILDEFVRDGDEFPLPSREVAVGWEKPEPLATPPEERTCPIEFVVDGGFEMVPDPGPREIIPGINAGEICNGRLPGASGRVTGVGTVTGADIVVVKILTENFKLKITKYKELSE